MQHKVGKNPHAARQGQDYLVGHFDGNHGPIAEAWLMNHWTTTFLIDRHGIIRARDLRGPELARAIEAALH